MQFSASEKQIKNFCEAIQPGTALDRLKFQINKFDLVADWDNQLESSDERNAQRIVSIDAGNKFGSGWSFCTISIENAHVQTVSYNPWYH